LNNGIQRAQVNVMKNTPFATIILLEMLMQQDTRAGRFVMLGLCRVFVLMRDDLF
jgi:hypothetical protein